MQQQDLRPRAGGRDDVVAGDHGAVEHRVRWQQIGQELPEDDTTKVVERQVNMLDRQALDQAYRGSGSCPAERRDR